MRHILLVSYDIALLNTRQFLLESHGYTVTSAADFADALRKCKGVGYDLLIIGYSVPVTDKQALIAAITKHRPTPVVTLRKPGEGELRGVNESIEGNKPEPLLAALERLLAEHASRYELIHPKK